MVCADEVAARFPFRPVGSGAGPASGATLCRTGLLIRRLGGGGVIRAAMQDTAAIKQDILARARAEGFDLVRFAVAKAEPGNARRLRDFLEAGHHGGMGWMEKRADWRADPCAMWPQAQSVI